MPANIIGLNSGLRRFASWVVAISFVASVGFPGRSVQGAAPEADQTWPQFRGPLGTGAAPSATPPIEWSADKNIRWKAKIAGSGTSTPVVWGNQIFLLTAIPTGKKIESAEQPASETAPNPGAEGAAPKGAQSSNLAVRARFVADEKPAPAADPNAAAAPAGAAPAADAKSAPADGKAAPEGDAKGPPGGKGFGGGRPGGGGRGGFGRPPEKPTEYHQFVLLCLDRRNGQVLWQQVAAEVVPHEGHHPDHGYASYTPATDGTCVIASFGSRGVYCYDMQGKLKWQKDLGKMQTKFSFGEGTSPALYGNIVVIKWDHEGDDFIVALDKETGAELWRTPREEETGWATPLIVDYQGQLQVIAQGAKVVRSYDLKTGKQLWECSGMTPAAIPTPLTADGIVYVMSGFRGSSLLAIRLGGTGDLTGTDSIVWSRTTDTPYVPSPMLYDNRLYFYKSNNAILTCLNAKTGETYFGPERLEGISSVYASPLGAGGHVYLAGRDGTVLVINNADKFEVVATNKMDDRFDASPVAVGSDLLLRGKEYLYCISDQSTASLSR